MLLGCCGTGSAVPQDPAGPRLITPPPPGLQAAGARGPQAAGGAGSRMALLIKQLNPVISHYRDRRFDGNQEQFEERLRTSTTVYVGNLSFYTTEDQIYEVRALWVVRSCRLSLFAACVGRSCAALRCAGLLQVR